MNIQEELQAWAKETVAAYHEIARKENKAYYTQSDLSLISERPELMIVGINPGSEGSYKDQCENKNWSYLYKNNIDANHLLKGNYCREEGKPSAWENHKKWKYWNGLKRCLSQTNLKTILDDDRKIIITNASFFSTSKANEISDSLLIETIPFTLKMIDKTDPKHLIFLSGKSCFEKLHRISKSSNIIQFEYKHVCGNIFIGKLNGKLCVGIPHPTYKTNEELELVASVIPHLISSDNYEKIDIALIQKECSKQINKFDERNNSKANRPYIHINATNIVEQINNKISLNIYEQNEKTKRYKINDKYGITVTCVQKGYIAIRHIIYNPSGYNDTQDKEVLHLRDILSNRGYNTSDKVWIGTKPFSKFGQNDDDIIKEILNEIEELKKICKA